MNETKQLAAAIETKLTNVPTELINAMPVTTVKEHSNNNNFRVQIEKFIENAGTIMLLPEQEEILYKAVVEEDVEIRPDGLIYLPWMEYATRLRKAFKMKWALVPNGDPKVNGNYVMREFYLIINGTFASSAIGEQLYYPNNATMTWGDACEGAKSNALMRCCKEIGITLELWKPSFVRAWKEKYAEEVLAKYPDGNPKLDKYGKQKKEWRLNGSKTSNTETDSDVNTQSQQPRNDMPKITEKQIGRLMAILNNGSTDDTDRESRELMLRDWVVLKYGIRSKKDIPRDRDTYDIICSKADDIAFTVSNPKETRLQDEPDAPESVVIEPEKQTAFTELELRVATLKELAQEYKFDLKDVAKELNIDKATEKNIDSFEVAVNKRISKIVV